MSRTKPFFPNRRSAVISILTIAVLLVLIVFGIEASSRRILRSSFREAEGVRLGVVECMASRFSYAGELASLLAPEYDVSAVVAAVSRFDVEGTPSDQGKAYDELDKALADLQKRVFTDPSYPLYGAYFDKLFSLEQELVPLLRDYEGRIGNFNAQVATFPSSLAARHLGYSRLLSFSLSRALQGRP